MEFKNRISQFLSNLFTKKHNRRDQDKLDNHKQFSDSVRKQFEELKEKGLSIPIFTL